MRRSVQPVNSDDLSRESLPVLLSSEPGGEFRGKALSADSWPLLTPLGSGSLRPYPGSIFFVDLVVYHKQDFLNPTTLHYTYPQMTPGLDEGGNVVVVIRVSVIVEGELFAICPWPSDVRLLLLECHVKAGQQRNVKSDRDRHDDHRDCRAAE